MSLKSIFRHRLKERKGRSSAYSEKTLVEELPPIKIPEKGQSQILSPDHQQESPVDDEIVPFSANAATTVATRPQAPILIKQPTRSATLKNSLVLANRLAAGIFSNTWLSSVFNSTVLVMESLGKLELNDELADDLARRLDAFLYIVSECAHHKPSQPIVDDFQRTVQRIAEMSVDSTNKIVRFINADDRKNEITRLNQALDGAVQTLQVRLQLATIQSLQSMNTGKVERWKADLNDRLYDGDIVKNLVRVNAQATKAISLDSKGSGLVSHSVHQSRFVTNTDFKIASKGSIILEELQDLAIVADGDITLSSDTLKDEPYGLILQRE